MIEIGIKIGIEIGIEIGIGIEIKIATKIGIEIGMKFLTNYSSRFPLIWHRVRFEFELNLIQLHMVIFNVG